MSKHVTRATIDDAVGVIYTREQADDIVAAYPEHERDARAKGIPVLGSGRIFPMPQSEVSIDAFAVPEHWAQLGALDFGWDHPTAGVRLVWDRDPDIVYVTSTYRVRQATPVIHAAALKPWGHWLPWAWPHDGYQHDKGGSGQELRQQYLDQGLNMLPEHATHVDGGTGVEAGLMAMLDRMQTGRLKVFSHLNDWFDEFNLYHRADGKVVKEYDDLMSATRYGIMMLRFAATEPLDDDEDDYEYGSDRSANAGYGYRPAAGLPCGVRQHRL